MVRAILIILAIACAAGCGARTQRQVTADTRAAGPAGEFTVQVFGK